MAINTRSPNYISTSIANTYYSILEIYIWAGSATDTSVPITYSLKKYALNSSTFVSYETSELTRDYIDVTFDGDYETPLTWQREVIKVYDDTNTLISNITYATKSVFESYSYFEEDSFNIQYKSLLISNRELFVLADNSFRIPIHTRTSPTVIFIGKEDSFSQSFSSSTQSSEQIKYVSKNGVEINYDSFKSRVLLESTNSQPSTFEDNRNLQDFFDEFNIGEIDRVVVTGTDGTQTINIKTIEECKYEPKKVTFVNKFGVLQDMFFFKKSVESMDVQKESYKANTRNEFNEYSKSSHVNRDFNIVAKESVTLSSGYLSEEYNEVFKQLMLSEKVWVTNVTDTEVQVLPINVKTSNITYKTSVNNKLVEYTIEFDNSFDTINNIR